jgi:hypothetical protein
MTKLVLLFVKEESKMGDNPFKEEQMSVFKDAPTNEKKQIETTFPANSQKKQPEEDPYSKFPKWDLLPPFKLIKRGGQK